MSFTKTKCEITRKEFESKATEIPVTVGEDRIFAKPKQFASGTFGWNLTGKAYIQVDGKLVKVQVSGNLVVIGSKDAE